MRLSRLLDVSMAKALVLITIFIYVSVNVFYVEELVRSSNIFNTEYIESLEKTLHKIENEELTLTNKQYAELLRTSAMRDAELNVMEWLKKLLYYSFGMLFIVVLSGKYRFHKFSKEKVKPN